MRALLVRTSGAAGALIDPYRLAQEWGRIALEAGVEIHEYSPVLGVRNEGFSIEVATPSALVRAAKVAVTTGAATSELEGFEPRLRRAIAPLNPWAAATPPLSEDLWASVGYEHHDAVKTMFGLPHIFHRAPDGRMHLANEQRVEFTVRARDHSLAFARDVERQLHEFYPQLRDVGIEYHRGGGCSITPDLIPRIGVASDRRVGYAFGWNGHGVALTQAAGRTVAQLLVEDRTVGHPWFVNRVGPAWPSRIAAQAGLLAARRGYLAMDRRRFRALPITG